MPKTAEKTTKVGSFEFLLHGETECLGVVPLPSDDVLLISISRYRERTGIDIRSCFLDEQAGAYRPTKHGIRCTSADSFKELLALLTKESKRVLKQLE